VHDLDVFRNSLDFLEEGLSVFDENLKLVIANRKFIELLSFPEKFSTPGTDIRDIFRFNAERGEYGEGDVEQQIDERVQQSLNFKPHDFERQRPDGKIIRVIGNPIESGGFITTYRDVTNERINQYMIEQELEMATGLQKSMLPDDQQLKSICEQYAIQVRGNMMPVSGIGGDMWGLRRRRENRLAFYLIDVCGHGISAALNAFRVHTVIHDSLPKWGYFKNWIEMINEKVSLFMPRGQFSTYIVGILDFEKGLMRYAAGGAPSILFASPTDETPAKLLDTKGFPIGISTKDFRADIREVPLPESWGLMMYSDGLTETPDPSGRLIGEKEWLQLFESGLHEGGANTAFDRVNSVIQEKLAASLKDDLTYVCLSSSHH
jgi:serine phosphatase RsbU (regulator of sigma subunit)